MGEPELGRVRRAAEEALWALSPGLSARLWLQREAKRPLQFSHVADHRAWYALRRHIVGLPEGLLDFDEQRQVVILGAPLEEEEVLLDVNAGHDLQRTTRSALRTTMENLRTTP